MPPPPASTPTSYQYIIAGAGMAGLSMAYYLCKSTLPKLPILILDRSPKTANDRTWCYWEQAPGPFESIVQQQWQQITTINPQGQQLLQNTAPYHYKMIRGIDFYQYIYAELQLHSHVQFLYTEILELGQTPSEAFAKTSHGMFTAQYLFDSATQLHASASLASNSKLVNQHTGRHNLYQHFMGYVIDTEHGTFNPTVATLMDFAINQHNDCRFMYVLPLSSHKALVEYTVFSDKILEKESYRSQLSSYISDHLQIGNYQIVEQEYGVIPMTDEPSRLAHGRIVRIGTAGGYTNPATGYTFSNTQKNLQKIVAHIGQHGKPVAPKSSYRHSLYAATLLRVLARNRYPAAQFFSELYSKNTAAEVFRFLDTDTNFWQEIKIMSSTPIGVFGRAMFEELFAKN
jgi:lycopene beta-cyclase